ncbi:ABC transporter permease [Paenibacillus sp. tmac-D7]|uniref:ABC transporter permease n=1 Tax=Paenibacillus sp. tmac-D7 TaxID=2591462 RepID=UPI00114322DA|nr:ABC transporter permease [Paenibacillus sp. tmac-D7]
MQENTLIGENVKVDASTAVPEEEPKRNSAWNKFKSDPVAWITGLFIAMLLTSAIFAPFIAPYDPYIGSATERLQQIGSPGHVLGTDEQGRDMLTRVLYGLRLTILMGLLPVLIAGVVGLTLGIIAGFYGKRMNTLIMRSMDVFYAFPAVVLAIAISAAVGPGIQNSFIALPFVFIPPIVRVVETSVQQVKGHEFFEAARASGAGDWMIIRYHLLGNIMRPVLSFVTTLFGLSIIISTGLSFLGLGVTPPVPELGSMLRSLQSSLYIQPWVAIVPGTVIFLLALSFNLFSDSLQDMFDSKI